LSKVRTLLTTTDYYSLLLTIHYYSLLTTHYYSLLTHTGPPDRVSAALSLVEYQGPRDHHGNFTVHVRVTDLAGDTAAVPLVVRVSNVNDAPEVLRPTHILQVNETQDLSLFQVGLTCIVDC
jgi:hypothetical protein